MSLDPQLWESLQGHGVTEEHLLLLLQILQIQRNGFLALHFVRGRVDHIDTRLIVPNRRVALTDTAEMLGSMTAWQEP